MSPPGRPKGESLSAQREVSPMSPPGRPKGESRRVGPEGVSVKAPPRVVLDTNVVLSALLFRGGTAARVRTAWQSIRFVPLASTATAQEIVHVLAYPKFGLAADERAELLADYMPWVQVVRIPQPPPVVPPCRDPHDVSFLHLAAAGRARALVSGDRDLLAPAGAPGICPILSVAAFCGQYLGD